LGSGQYEIEHGKGNMLLDGAWNTLTILSASTGPLSLVSAAIETMHQTSCSFVTFIWQYCQQLLSV
jgi:hypothetical protein